MREKKSCLLWTEDSCIFVRSHKGDGLKHLRCFEIFLTSFMLRKFSSWVRPGIDPESTDFDCWQGTIKGFFWTADRFVGFGSGQSCNTKWFQGTVAWDTRIDMYRFTLCPMWVFSWVNTAVRSCQPGGCSKYSKLIPAPVFSPSIQDVALWERDVVE